MARPRKNPLPTEGATESVSAPATVQEAYVPEPVYQPVYQPPARNSRNMVIERQGATSEPTSHRFPQVRGGVCEFCGVLDRNVPSQYQYKLCPHYRGQQLRCSYCPDNVDPDEVVYHADLNVAENPYNPGVLIVWCNKYECSKAHTERFKRSRS